jgi:FkbM family methyltransferase
MNRFQRLARRTILGANELRVSRVARHFPVREASLILSNRVVPLAARLAFRPGIQDVNGVCMLVPSDGAGAGGERYMALGTYEAQELDYVVNRLPMGGCFVDVGAHIGYFTLAAAKKVGPDGRVIALEPTPSSAAVLRRNVAMNGFEGRVSVIEAAASAVSGSGTLVQSASTPMWNTLEPDTLEDTVEGISVCTVTIDDVLRGEQWPPVHVLKLDVEGHEQSVLTGAKETLSRYPDLEIIFEASGTSAERFRVSFETISYLNDRGFKFFFFESAGGVRAATIDDLAARMRMPRWQDSLFNVVSRR